MGRRTARQSAHSAVVHGGHIRWQFACEEGHADWDVVSISTEESFDVVGGGYCRASVKLCERHRCVLHRQRNKRAAAWSLERDLCDRLSEHRVQVRIISANECDLRVKVRCWFANFRKPEAQKRLEAMLREALVALSARNEEVIRRDELSAIAQRHTPADYELSRSSWVRRLGVPVRPHRIGFFCAFPWDYTPFPWDYGDTSSAQLEQGERLIAHEEPTSARMGRRASPAHCSARAGCRRSRRLKQSTEKLSLSRARAGAARTRGSRRRREADEKQRERDLFVDVAAIGRRRAAETVASYGVAYGVECWLVRWSPGGAATRERWMQWGDLLSEELQNAAQERKEEILYGNPWWPHDGPDEQDLRPGGWEVALGAYAAIVH